MSPAGAVLSSVCPFDGTQLAVVTDFATTAPKLPSILKKKNTPRFQYKLPKIKGLREINLPWVDSYKARESWVVSNCLPLGEWLCMFLPCLGL